MYPVAPVRKIRIAAVYHSSLVARDTLIDFFDDLARARGDFLVYDDGFRSRGYTYARGRARARAASPRACTSSGCARATRLSSGARTARSGSSRSGAACSRGIVVVPIDYRASPDFLARVSRIVAAKLVLIGQDVPPLAERRSARRSWKLHELDWPRAATAAAAASTIGRDDVAEIIFTSGATAEPKGVVITHRNVLANIVPVEREVAEVPEVGPAVLPAALPEPAAAQPHVRPGDGDVHPADAAGRRRLHARLQPGDIVAQIKTRRDLGARVGAEDPRRAARARRCASRRTPASRRAPKQHVVAALVALSRASIGCSA